MRSSLSWPRAGYVAFTDRGFPPSSLRRGHLDGCPPRRRPYALRPPHPCVRHERRQARSVGQARSIRQCRRSGSRKVSRVSPLSHSHFCSRPLNVIAALVSQHFLHPLEGDPGRHHCLPVERHRAPVRCCRAGEGGPREELCRWRQGRLPVCRIVRLAHRLLPIDCPANPFFSFVSGAL